MTPRGLENLFAFGFRRELVEWQWEKRVERLAIIKNEEENVRLNSGVGESFMREKKYVKKNFTKWVSPSAKYAGWVPVGRYVIARRRFEDLTRFFLRKNNSVEVPASGLGRPSRAHALKIINEMENERKTIPWLHQLHDVNCFSLFFAASPPPPSCWLMKLPVCRTHTC